MSDTTVRPVRPADAEWVARVLEERWSSQRIVSRGVVHDALALPGFIAEIDGAAQGLLTFRIDSASCEIVTLDSLVERRGIGSALLAAVRSAAIAAGCNRLWLVTTNDNVRAMRFYERAGFRRVAIHANALRRSRELKPEIPLFGIGGVPLRDEIEFEQAL